MFQAISGLRLIVSEDMRCKNKGKLLKGGVQLGLCRHKIETRCAIFNLECMMKVAPNAQGYEEIKKNGGTGSTCAQIAVPLATT